MYNLIADLNDICEVTGFDNDKLTFSYKPTEGMYGNELLDCLFDAGFEMESSVASPDQKLGFEVQLVVRAGKHILRWAGQKDDVGSLYELGQRLCDWTLDGSCPRLPTGHSAISIDGFEVDADRIESAESAGELEALLQMTIERNA